MRNVIAICKREIFSFFVSPVAYFVITGFLLLAGYFFFNLLGFYNIMIARYNAMRGMVKGDDINLNQWVVEGYYHTLIVILVFLIPLLTMRILAEDKRRGTFELLLTSPISISEIVWGKFLSLAFVVLLMMFSIFIFPFLLCVYSSPEALPILVGLLGLTLCALSFASIGMAASSFSENQVVAGVSSMVVLLMLYVINSPGQSFGGNTAVILDHLSPVVQVRDMLRGVITLKALIYFSSLIALGLFLSKRALEAHRWR